MIKKKNSVFKERIVSKKSQWIDPNSLSRQLYSEQQLIPKHIKILQAELFQWHFPTLKHRRNHYQKYLNLLTLQDFKEFHYKHRKRKKIDYSMLDEKVIYEILNQFNIGDKL